MRKFLIGGVMLVLAVVIVGGSIFAQDTTMPISNNNNTTAINTTSTNSLAQVYDLVSPSVVSINVSMTAQNGQLLQSGSGSGFVLDNAGHIITNNHVVNDATFIEIEFYDGTLAEAQIVGLDPDSDLAVLKVDVGSNHLFPVTFDNSDALAIGEDVLAIGSPYGQDWTLTTGIVSGLNRIISGLNNFSIGGIIQTDAAINPGNSGGPLLNTNGQVIGVNSQILSQSGSNSGVGFAIPSNLVQRVAQELITNGEVNYSYIGISGTDINLSIIQTLNLPEETRGILITEAVANGPAARAGIQNANIARRASTTSLTDFDIITAINGVQIRGINELISYLASDTRPGDTVTLSILRNGHDNLELTVQLSERP